MPFGLTTVVSVVLSCVYVGSVHSVQTLIKDPSRGRQSRKLRWSAHSFCMVHYDAIQ